VVKNTAILRSAVYAVTVFYTCRPCA